MKNKPHDLKDGHDMETCSKVGEEKEENKTPGFTQEEEMINKPPDIKNEQEQATCLKAGKSYKEKLTPLSSSFTLGNYFNLPITIPILLLADHAIVALPRRIVRALPVTRLPGLVLP